ncbi:hypothetical protein [Okeania sp. SIO3B5]|uniref:hypothetical protein n=1 Tax=Okeania sp. SIO3B5 TaxID=2607811 RepID=UPI0025D9B663|nr:hypothetical protein [Okeania sp. SIO3B5]
MKLSIFGRFWHYPIFYVSAVLSLVFIVLGMLTYLLNLFSPPFWVELILELTNSTYEEIVQTCGLANLGLQIIDGLSSNLPFVLLWLGLAWISLMWMLVIPIDHLLCYRMKIPYYIAGKIAYFNAIFWAVATPILWIYANPWVIARLLAGVLYVAQGCDIKSG